MCKKHALIFVTMLLSILGWSSFALAGECVFSLGAVGGAERRTAGTDIVVEDVNGDGQEAIAVEVFCDEPGRLDARPFTSSDGVTTPVRVGHWGRIEGAERSSYSVVATLPMGVHTSRVVWNGQYLTPSGALDGQTHTNSANLRVEVVPSQTTPPPAEPSPVGVLGPPETDQPDETEDEDEGKKLEPPVYNLTAGGNWGPNDEFQTGSAWGGFLEFTARIVEESHHVVGFALGGMFNYRRAEVKVNPNLTLENVTSVEHQFTLAALALCTVNPAWWFEFEGGGLFGAWVDTRDQTPLNEFENGVVYEDQYTIVRPALGPVAKVTFYPQRNVGLGLNFMMPIPLGDDVQRGLGNGGHPPDLDNKDEGTPVLPTIGVHLRGRWD